MQPILSPAPAERSPGRNRARESDVLACTGTAPGWLPTTASSERNQPWWWHNQHRQPSATSSALGHTAPPAGLSHAATGTQGRATRAGQQPHCGVLCTAPERCRVSSASDEAQRPRETPPSYPSPALALSAHAARKKHRVNSSAWTRGPPHEASSSAPPSSRLLEGHHSVVAPRNRLSET